MRSQPESCSEEVKIGRNCQKENLPQSSCRHSVLRAVRKQPATCRVKIWAVAAKQRESIKLRFTCAPELVISGQKSPTGWKRMSGTQL